MRLIYIVHSVFLSFENKKYIFFDKKKNSIYSKKTKIIELNTEITIY